MIFHGHIIVTSGHCPLWTGTGTVVALWLKDSIWQYGLNVKTTHSHGCLFFNTQHLLPVDIATTHKKAKLSVFEELVDAFLNLDTKFHHYFTLRLHLSCTFTKECRERLVRIWPCGISLIILLQNTNTNLKIVLDKAMLQSTFFFF